LIAAALLDRLLHHAIVVEIEGNSYRLREHGKAHWALFALLFH
jgi:DNA replication protein DnaC